jgi:hypothetical protein
MDGKSMTEAERLAERTPERIWLIDMGDCIAWCDDPDPSGTGEDDAVEYVRAALIRSQAEELERLRGALLHIVAIANTRDIEDTEAGFKPRKSAVHVPYKLVNRARAALGEM